MIGGADLLKPRDVDGCPGLEHHKPGYQGEERRYKFGDGWEASGTLITNWSFLRLDATTRAQTMSPACIHRLQTSAGVTELIIHAKHAPATLIPGHMPSRPHGGKIEARVRA